MTLRSVGASRAVWISAFGGVLLNFHAAGVIPVVGLAAFAAALYGADRNGLIVEAGAVPMARITTPESP